MDDDVVAALKQRGLDSLGLVFDEKTGDMVMHASMPDLSRYSISRQLQDFRPFGHSGVNEEVRELMAVKKNGWLYYAFEYEYGAPRQSEDGVGNADTQGSGFWLGRFGVVAADVTVDLPMLTIEPATAASSIAEHLGFSSVKFESAEFNKRYSVKCDEEKRAYELLNPQAIEVLLKTPDMTWQMGGRHIVLFQNGGLTGDFAGRAIDASFAFTACIPGFVQQDHAASRPNL